MNGLSELIDTGISAYSQNAGQFVLGLVSENGNKDFPGMVKAEFTAWAQGQRISQWIPVLTPYAGKEHGRFIVPEVGDIVLIGFLGSDMRNPFIMGSFFPAGAGLPGKTNDPKNLKRSLKTKGGIEMNLSDEKDKEKAEITLPHGLKAAIDDSNDTVTITDKNGKNVIKLDAKKNAVEVTADTKLSLKSGKCSIEMDGKGGALTIKCDRLSIEAGQTASIKSNNMFTVEGGLLTVDGKQKLTLKGAAMSELSGGMVKIN